MKNIEIIRKNKIVSKVQSLPQGSIVQ